MELEVELLLNMCKDNSASGLKRFEETLYMAKPDIDSDVFKDVARIISNRITVAEEDEAKRENALVEMSELDGGEE